MSNSATKSQREVFAAMAALGCVICGDEACIHHCETGMGRKKSHDKVIPLCHNHHQGAEGIHTIGKKTWQAQYGTEQELMERARKLIE